MGDLLFMGCLLFMGDLLFMGGPSYLHGWPTFMGSLLLWVVTSTNKNCVI